MKGHRKQSGFWMVRGGLLLIAAALFLTGWNLWDEYRADRKVGQTLEQVKDQMPAKEGESMDQPSSKFMEEEGTEMPTVMIGNDSYIGILDIPSLNITLPVMEEWSYPKLRTAPCRYTGSVYTNALIIAAHNYRNHFGRLETLTVGEPITFTDMNGNVFQYTVAKVENIKPTAVEELTDSDWPLTLFTCTISGQSRVVVRCA